MPSEWAEKGADFIRGDDAFLHKTVAPEIGRKHVTELLHQHPFHPFNPEIREESHPCYNENWTFYQCMVAMEEKDKSMPLHMKHVNCYHPFKTDLMKCLVKMRKAEKEKKTANLNEALQK